MICKHLNCKKPVKTSKLCSKHYLQEWRKNNPLKYAYSNLKSSAKKRNHEFAISFEYFCKFAIETDYIGQKGKKSTSYSIDRIKNELGYIEGNLQILTLSENSKKGMKVLSAAFDHYSGKVIATVKSIQHSKVVEDCPF